MNEQLILAEITAAKDGVTDAESDLARALSEIQAVLRAEKTTVTEALRNAFDKLRSAREHLVTLEKLARGQND